MANEKLTAFQDRLKFLMKTTNATPADLSKIINAPITSVPLLISGTSFPRVQTLLALADYFAVPLDYLMGRCELDAAKEIEKNYSSCFMQLRRAPYENYFIGREPLALDKKVEAPWPYNIHDAIKEESEEETSILSEDDIKTLYGFLDLLDKGDKTLLLQYYKDGLSLAKIGDDCGTCEDAIQTRINNAICHLRYFYQKLRAEDDSQNFVEPISELIKNLQKGNSADVPIECLDLSVRAYNALKRNHCDTISSLTVALETGEIQKFRTVGKGIINEITSKLMALKNDAEYQEMILSKYKRFKESNFQDCFHFSDHTRKAISQLGPSGVAELQTAIGMLLAEIGGNNIVADTTPSHDEEIPDEIEQEPPMIIEQKLPMIEDIDAFAEKNNVSKDMVLAMTQSYFQDTKNVTKETIRQELVKEGVTGLLRITNVVNNLFCFMADCRRRFPDYTFS